MSVRPSTGPVDFPTSASMLGEQPEAEAKGRCRTEEREVQMNRSIVLVTLLAGLCAAGVIRVPSEQPTIQAGLAAAGAGDTVLVAPGTYPERITWPALDGIVLLSEQGAGSTTIDGGRAGRVLTMNALGYTAATMVQGFRVTNGQATGSAAGVSCRGTPVFIGNEIVDNLGLQGTTGGGVYADGAPLFAYNLIARDSLWVADMAGFRYGGGVYCTGSGVFYQNVFADNAVFDSSCSGFRYGGALHLAGGTPLVFCNLFLRNSARMIDGSGFAYGGAVCVDDAVAACIVNNTFVGNVCSAHITYGGAVYAPWGATVIENNIFVQDSCLGSGSGGAIASDTTAMLVDYNDAWQNYPDDYYECTAGPNSLSADPLFVAAPLGDWCLSQTAAGQPEDSPCLDAGDTLPAIAALDLDSLIHAWTTRTDSVPDAAAIDIGYHYPPAPPTGMAAGPTRQPPVPALTAVPSPASGATVRLAGPLGRFVAVYDASGRRVIERRLTVNGDGALLDISRLAAGVYVLRTNLGGRSSLGRLVVRR